MKGEPEEKEGVFIPLFPRCLVSGSPFFTESPGCCLAGLSCNARSHCVPGEVLAAQDCCALVHRHSSWLPSPLPPTLKRIPLLNAHLLSHVHPFHSFRWAPPFPTETHRIKG